MRYRGPKGKICRRFGVNLFGNAKYTKLVQTKGHPPGAHGKRRFGKKSEFGKQLEEKQKLRFMFGLSERQFRNYYKKADRSMNVTGQELLRLLERRLDNVLFRAGFAMSRDQARQIVSHGLTMVNGRRVKTPSIQVKEGDVVEIREKNRKSPLFEIVFKELSKYKAPKWLEANQGGFKITVKSLPDQEDVEKLIDTQRIVEYYSK